MSVEALRRVMSLAAQGMDEDLAAAFYELLLATPLHVPMANGNASLMRGPSGQLALPVFLDDASLKRWGGATSSRSCSAQRAAEVALGGADVWMVIDPGSSPGGQPVARAGVEALARGTYPGAERYENEVDFVNSLAGAARSGSFDRGLVEKARRARLITIGRAALPGENGSGGSVTEVEAMELLSVRGPDGASLCVAWPTPGPSYAFMPDSPRMTLPFATLLRAAAQVRRGIVIDPYRMPIPIPFQQLAKLGALL